MATQRPVHIDSTSGNVRELVAGDKLGGVTNGTATGEALTFDSIGASVQAYSASTTLLGNTVTGTGSIVLATSPTLITPVLGVASATSLACPTFTTSSGAMGITPASGSNLNVTLAGAGDLNINSGQLYVDTSAARVGVNTVTPLNALHLEVGIGFNGLLMTHSGFAHGITNKVSTDGVASFSQYGSGGGAYLLGITDNAGYNAFLFDAVTTQATGFQPVTLFSSAIKSGASVESVPSGDVAFAWETSGNRLLSVFGNGSLTLRDGANINTGATTGTCLATSATTNKLSVFNATTIVQPTAAGQAALAAQGQQTLTDSTAGTAGTTLAAVTGAVYATDIPAIRNWIASLAAQLALVKTDVENLRTLVAAQRTAMVNFGSMKGS